MNSIPANWVDFPLSYLHYSFYSPSVSFDLETLGGKVADTASPAEAINYFCDIRMEEELERVRAQTREKTPVQVQDNTRNTVLVLPKIHRYYCTDTCRDISRVNISHSEHYTPCETSWLVGRVVTHENM